MSRLVGVRLSLSLAALGTALFAQQVQAEGAVAPAVAADNGEQIIVTAKTTRSATSIPAAEMQKILPGVAPLKAIATLPGVLYLSLIHI